MVALDQIVTVSSMATIDPVKMIYEALGGDNLKVC